MWCFCGHIAAIYCRVVNFRDPAFAGVSATGLVSYFRPGSTHAQFFKHNILKKKSHLTLSSVHIVITKIYIWSRVQWKYPSSRNIGISFKFHLTIQNYIKIFHYLKLFIKTCSLITSSERQCYHGLLDTHFLPW